MREREREREQRVWKPACQPVGGTRCEAAVGVPPTREAADPTLQPTRERYGWPNMGRIRP